LGNLATVKDLLAVKGAETHSVGPDVTALDAALLMNEHRVGCLLVIDGGAASSRSAISCDASSPNAATRAPRAFAR
jgi:hypothetical protein